MRPAGRIFRFFIYSNLFIAIAAVLMTVHSSSLLLGTLPSAAFSWFVFFATITSYSFHWYLTPAASNDLSERIRWLSRNKNVHLALFVVGLAGLAVTGWFLLAFWRWLLLAAFVTFLYSAPKIPHPLFRALRKVAIGKTIFLAFVWMYVTAIMPLQLSPQRWTIAFTIFAASRFFFLYAICILFDYRDREYDRQVGIRSLITWLSESQITALFAVSLVIHFGLTLMLAFYGFTLLQLSTLLFPGVVLALLHRRARNDFGDLFYYFTLDGLMFLSALIAVLSHQIL